MKKSIIALSLLAVVGKVSAQDKNLQVSGYVEAYYTYDFNKPANNVRPGFIYSHNRHNEVNLNLGFVKASYNAERFRGNLALMAGTYSNANLAAEPGVLKNVYEMNGGYKLSSTKNLWVDAGIFASHIGFESAVSKDCWTLTRSILAENSPYYESGAKLSYLTDDGKWFLSGLVLNGWQRIQRVDGNSTLGIGTQVQYKPTANITLNHSSFIGNDKPDTLKVMRYFNNVYGTYQMDKLGLTLGVDFGWEQKAKGLSEYNNWYSPVIIARYQINDKLAIAGRAEYYNDENGVIIASGTENGFKTQGYSLNVDVMPIKNVMFRVEGRMLKSKDEVFLKGDEPTDRNSFVTTSLAVSF